jgi:hypothetical protein
MEFSLVVVYMRTFQESKTRSHFYIFIGGTVSIKFARTCRSACHSAVHIEHVRVINVSF